MVKGTDEPAVGTDEPVGAADWPAKQRHLVEIREGIAAVAAGAADADMARVFAALDRHAELVELLAQTEATWHPAAIRTAKESAHATFRKAVAAARERNTVEAAAAVWLDEINRINVGLRAAEIQIRREREAATALLVEIDLLCIQADSSRARADAAIESCRTARRELAGALGLPEDDDSAEAAAGAAAPTGRTPTLGPASVAGEATAVVVAAVDEPAAPDAAEARELHRQRRPRPDAVDLDARPRQALLALLSDGEEAVDRIANRLAVGDAEGPIVWRTRLRDLVAALTAAAADAGELEFPRDGQFWGQFTVAEARAIARALGALGFLNDGGGGFVGGRMPSQHDLVAATGAAGLLPVRIRHFPSLEEIPDLYRDVRVAADELLAERAPYLTLGEVILLLGRRAEPLADTWNEWPRVRELLLAPET